MPDSTTSAPNGEQQDAHGVVRGAEVPTSAGRNLAPSRPVVILCGLFAAGAAIRALLLGQPSIGHDADLSLFVGWIRGLSEGGFAGFYASGAFCDYPPVMMLLFRAIGVLAGALVGDPNDHLLRIAVKSMACAFELGIAGLLVLEGRRLVGPRAGLLAGGLFLFNPAAIYESAYWGQVDAIPTALALGSLALLGRERWGAAGCVAALGLAAKFQVIVVLPLLVFEAFRLRGPRGIVVLAAGGLLGLALASAPFVVTGTFPEIVSRAYVDVVGQYPRLSNNAYNLWFIGGDPAATDTAVPPVVLRAAAGERMAFAAGDSWLLGLPRSAILGLTWRHISLVLFGLVVATVISLYARRPGPIARYGAAGLLVLAFYLFPTEMHERYAYPALALLAPWAASGSLRERLYWAFSLLLLLNLAAVLPIAPLAPQLALLNLILFLALLASVGLSRISPPLETVAARRATGARPSSIGVAPLPPGASRGISGVIRTFQVATIAGWGLAVVIAVAVLIQGRETASLSPAGADVVWLTQIPPRTADQGWGALTRDGGVGADPSVSAIRSSSAASAPMLPRIWPTRFPREARRSMRSSGSTPGRAAGGAPSSASKWTACSSTSPRC